MAYLYWYLGIGAAVLAVIFVSRQLTESAVDAQLSELRQAADPDRGKWWWKPLNYLIFPVLAVMVVAALVPVWPIVIYWNIKGVIESRQLRRNRNIEPHPEFTVTRDRLLRRLLLHEIEASEIVMDPLEAAPALPFGHLHSAWETFKASIRADDAIWSFSAPWTTEWGRDELREGYVIVRGDAIGPHFLTKWIFIEKPGLSQQST